MSNNLDPRRIVASRVSQTDVNIELWLQNATKYVENALPKNVVLSEMADRCRNVWWEVGAAFAAILSASAYTWFYNTYYKTM